jgi:hypothetical protein
MTTFEIRYNARYTEQSLRDVWQTYSDSLLQRYDFQRLPVIHQQATLIDWSNGDRWQVWSVLDTAFANQTRALIPYSVITTDKLYEFQVVAYDAAHPCESNIVAVDSQTATFRVRNPTASNISSTSITLSWLPPSAEQDPTSLAYRIQIKFVSTRNSFSSNMNAAFANGWMDGIINCLQPNLGDHPKFSRLDLD